MVGQNEIEAVIFDFGGVILDLDYPATDRALRSLLGEAGEIFYTKNYQSTLFDALEVGAIEPEEFYRSICEASGKDLDSVAIDKAWNAMLLDVPPARFQYLRDVARNYRSFLFSNTNAIHKAAFDQTLEKHLGPGGFDRLFEQAFYSHTFGQRKPNVQCYVDLLNGHGLQPEKTLFIDDNAENIKGARAAGLQVFHLTGDLLQENALKFLAR